MAEASAFLLLNSIALYIPARPAAFFFQCFRLCFSRVFSSRVLQSGYTDRQRTFV